MAYVGGDWIYPTSPYRPRVGVTTLPKISLDVKSAYPYGQLIANISKETTLLELSSIEGVSELDRRIVGLNLTGGDTNAVEFMTRMHNAPQLATLLALFEAEHTH